MAEQSSTVVLLRALVMLLCLIMIPVAALFGTAIPNVVKAFQAGRLPTLAELRGTPAVTPSPYPGSSNEAPRYVPGATASNVAPAWNGSSAGTSDTNASLAKNWPTQPNNSANLAAGNPAGVVPVSYNAPLDPRAASLTTGQLPAPDSASSTSHSLASLPSGNANLIPVERSGSMSTATSAAAAGADPFTFVQNRLRELGATYYLLESWGDSKREYRFYCKMAIGGNEQFTKAFWCVDGDPKSAMIKVLQQVEGWHSGGG